MSDDRYLNYLQLQKLSADLRAALSKIMLFEKKNMKDKLSVLYNQRKIIESEIEEIKKKIEELDNGRQKQD